MIAGYMIDFGCLYIPQELYFIGTFWLRTTDKYVKFGF